MFTKDKILYIVRGCPSSGKSSLAKSLGLFHAEADQYFTDSEGNYNFDIGKLKEAHNYCYNKVKNWMELGDDVLLDNNKIVVSNTFTQEWEMKPYFDLAEKHGYKVFSLIVEKRHNNENNHNVPKEKIEQMKKRFEIIL